MNTKIFAESKSGWIKNVDEKLRGYLEKAAYAAYDNGCELNKDAHLLFMSHRYSRAVALSILAEEEFSKAFTLKLSADNKRWDSVLFNSLRDHSMKQGIAQAVVECIAWEKAKARWVGSFTSSIPDEKKLREVVASVKEQLSKKEKDRLKQDALYVSITKDGQIKSLPNKFTRADAENSLLATEKFQNNVAILFGDQAALERFYKF